MSDEVSLRDLYLTLRRGAWLIVAITVLAGVATFAILSLRAPVYRSAAIAQVSPLAQVGESDARIATDGAIAFETYQAVATSRPVIDAVRATLEDAGLLAAESDFDATTLSENGELRRLSAAGAAPLTVEHGVADDDAEAAASIANAWASATLETLRTDLLADLAATGDAAQGELIRLTEARDAAREAWSTFRERDDRSLLQGRLQAISQERNEALARIGLLESDLRASQARQALLRTQLGSAPEGDPVTQLRVLQENDLIDEQTAEQLLLLLEQRSEASDNDLLALIRRTALQQELIDSAGMGAERDALREQVDTLATEAEALRVRIARLQSEGEVLEQELLRSEGEVEQLASIPSQVALARELLPTLGRIVNDAAPPLRPEPDRSGLLTVVAALLAGAAATLFVLLREAVRDPDASRPA